MKHSSVDENRSVDETGFSRRNFLTFASAACAAAVTPSRPARGVSVRRGPYTGKLCFFSKPLQSMDWPRLAQNVKRLGFEGVDLTVRKGGHVLPEKAAEDLPRAVSVIRTQGLEVPMVTTALVSASDPTARPILSAAGKLSITFYKPGYYLYDFVDIRRELEKASHEFRRLAELGKEYGMQVGYHNHAEYIGAPVWDIVGMIEGLDPKWVGYYFDVRHAVAEGGGAAWKIATKLVLGRLKMVALKDFYWEKAAAKGWQQRNCPLGEGMVDWKYFFNELAAANFQGPMSVHLEYEVPGSTHAAREDNTLAAAQRDLEFVKARIREAYGEN